MAFGSKKMFILSFSQGIKWVLWDLLPRDEKLAKYELFICFSVQIKGIAKFMNCNS